MMKHVYEVGMGSSKLKIEAPNAGAAAMYYALYCVHASNPFVAAVYTEDGAEWHGDMWWFNLRPGLAHAQMVIDRIKDDMDECAVTK